jgi:hypothetical protein
MLAYKVHKIACSIQSLYLQRLSSMDQVYTILENTHCYVMQLIMTNNDMYSTDTLYIMLNVSKNANFQQHSNRVKDAIFLMDPTVLYELFKNSQHIHRRLLKSIYLFLQKSAIGLENAYAMIYYLQKHNTRNLMSKYNKMIRCIMSSYIKHQKIHDIVQLINVVGFSEIIVICKPTFKITEVIPELFLLNTIPMAFFDYWTLHANFDCIGSVASSSDHEQINSIEISTKTVNINILHCLRQLQTCTESNGVVILINESILSSAIDRLKNMTMDLVQSCEIILESLCTIQHLHYIRTITTKIIRIRIIDAIIQMYDNTRIGEWYPGSEQAWILFCEEIIIIASEHHTNITISTCRMINYYVRMFSEKQITDLRIFMYIKIIWCRIFAQIDKYRQPRATSSILHEICYECDSVCNGDCFFRMLQLIPIRMPGHTQCIILKRLMSSVIKHYGTVHGISLLHTSISVLQRIPQINLLELDVARSIGRMFSHVLSHIIFMQITTEHMFSVRVYFKLLLVVQKRIYILQKKTNIKSLIFVRSTVRTLLTWVENFLRLHVSISHSSNFGRCIVHFLWNQILLDQITREGTFAPCSQTLLILLKICKYDTYNISHIGSFEIYLCLCQYYQNYASLLHDIFNLIPINQITSKNAHILCNIIYKAVVICVPTFHTTSSIIRLLAVVITHTDQKSTAQFMVCIDILNVVLTHHVLTKSTLSHYHAQKVLIHDILVSFMKLFSMHKKPGEFVIVAMLRICIRSQKFLCRRRDCFMKFIENPVFNDILLLRTETQVMFLHLVSTIVCPLQLLTPTNTTKAIARSVYNIAVNSTSNSQHAESIIMRMLENGLTCREYLQQPVINVYC